MLKVISLGLFFSLLGVFLVPNKASATIFRVLRQGDSGTDVLELQKILNIDPDTRIAPSGNNSSGFESGYFDEITHLAVVRFQEKYADLILKPFGLTTGTGFVGTKTLEKLNTLSGQIITTIVPPLPPPVVADKLTITSGKTATTSPKGVLNLNQISSAQDLGGLREVKMSRVMSLTSISPSSGLAGTKITLKGKGFSKISNDVFVGSVWYRSVKSTDGKTIVVTAPDPFKDFKDRSRIPTGGKFEIPIGIYVKNVTGATNGKIFNMSY